MRSTLVKMEVHVLSSPRPPSAPVSTDSPDCFVMVIFLLLNVSALVTLSAA